MSTAIDTSGNLLTHRLMENVSIFYGTSVFRATTGGVAPGLVREVLDALTPEGGTLPSIPETPETKPGKAKK
jgi:hypothetical protein